MSEMSQADPVADKVRLRREMKARRATLGLAERAAAADSLARHALAWIRSFPGACVSGFLSIGDELDTAPVLAALHAAGHPLCLPVMQGRDKRLLFRAWAPGDALDAVIWGIQEPKRDRPVVEPTVLLVPLLAFDAEGQRLGYGGGYYDRTLHALRKAGPVLAAGIGFDLQMVDAVPHVDYDERLDWVLTPSGPRRTAA